MSDAEQIPLPQIILIAALAEKNRVIGKGNELPWHIPEDLKRFKSLTEGHPLLMGRKTFESIVHQFGGPLPNRRHLILTSRETLDGFPDIETFSSIKDALRAVGPGETLFVGGGGDVYQQFLPLTDQMELTLIEGDYEGDTYFPVVEHLIGTLFTKTQEQNRGSYRFITYERLA